MNLCTVVLRVSASLVALCSLLVATPLLASPLFGPSVDYPSGNRPLSIQVGLLNNDAHLDVVCVNQTSSTLSVRLGSANGTLGPRTDYATATTPYFVVLDDVNADNELDALVASPGATVVSTFLGIGDGTFGPRIDKVVGVFVTALAVGNFHIGDTHKDLAVTNTTNAGVRILPGNGDGTFGTPVNYVTGASPRGVEIQRFNGDAHSDLAVTNQLDNTVAILLGNGNGTFGAATTYATGDRPQNVVAIDLDGDTYKDLVITNQGCGGPPAGSSVSVLMGNGDGTFDPKTDYGTGPGPAGLAVADIDSDGPLDIVTTNGNCSSCAGRGVSVLLGNGNGTFQTKLDYPTTPCSPINVAVGDLNLDSRLDLVTANFHTEANSISILFATNAPGIVSIKDVPGDQGGKVHVLWESSVLDTAANVHISTYNLWRRLTTTAAMQAVERGARIIGSAETIDEAAPRRPIRMIGEGAASVFWEFVVSVPARGVSGYADMTTTTSDSTPGSIPWNVFFVDAKDARNNNVYVSNPDSGYSVDNLPPLAPAMLEGSFSGASIDLEWMANAEDDFREYRVYRGSSADFPPGPGNLLTATGNTSYSDPGVGPWHYKVSAVDVHGNESAFSLLAHTGIAGVPGSVVSSLWLAPPAPNPAPGGALFRFGLPRPERVSLAIYDPAGRRVRKLVSSVLPAGEHQAHWDGRDATGRRVPGSLYLGKLEVEGRTITKKLLIVE